MKIDKKTLDKIKTAKRKDLTPKERKQQDILFYGKPITKKVLDNYKNFC